MEEPKWPVRSVTLPIVWRYIKENPGCTQEGISQSITGYSGSTVFNSLKRLLALGLIHVSGHAQYYDAKHRVVRQYMVGPGENAPRPDAFQMRREALPKLFTEQRVRLPPIAHMVAQLVPEAYDGV